MSKKSRDEDNRDTIKPQRRGTWWLVSILVTGIAGLVFLLNGAFSRLDLEVRRNLFTRTDGLIIEVINVGTKPIRLLNISINDRSDCSAKTPMQMHDQLFAPESRNVAFAARTLNVGDRASYNSNCLIVRAKIQTDRGSAMFSF